MYDISGLNNIDAPTANLPLGEMRNDVTPGDGTGTEIVRPYFQDIYYALYAVLNDASNLPDDSEEGASTSQFLDSLNTLYVRNDTSEFRLYDSAVAHGITALNLTTDTYGLSQINDSSGGGLDITGVSDLAGISGLTLRGIIGVADPTDTVPGISLFAGKKNGATWQALGSAETVFQVSNYTTSIITVLGNGNIGIGTTTPNFALNSGTVLTIIGSGTGASGAGVLELSNKEATGSSVLGVVEFNNLDAGSSPTARAIIAGYRDGADDASGLNFFTEPTGGATTARMAIDSNGVINITSGGVLKHNSITLSGYITSGVTGFATNAAIRTKVLEIGNWNMDTTADVFVTHGLTYSKIISVSAIIRDDSDSNRYNVVSSSASATSGFSLISWDSTYIRLVHQVGSVFDNSNFDTAAYNRGWIIVEYVD